MPFWRAFYHLVWCTRNRESLITVVIERQLLAVLIDKAAELGVYVHAVNACRDHVHMVAAIPPKVSVAGVVGQLKGHSAHELNRTLGGGFGWQRGYGVLTLGSRQLEAAIEYVRKQKEHHQGATTVSWLERDAEDDEGPIEGISTNGGRVLREEADTYEVDASAAEAGGW